MKYTLLLSTSLLLLACINVRAMDQRGDKIILQSSITKNVPLLAHLCKQYITRNFKHYDLTGKFDSTVLPADLKKTLFFDRLKYLNEQVECLQNKFNKEIFGSEFAYNEAHYNAFNYEVHRLAQQCYALLSKHLPTVLDTELTLQEAKTIVEQIESLDEKSLLDFIAIFMSLPADTSYYLNNIAHLQAACTHYGLEKLVLQSTQHLGQGASYHVYDNDDNEAAHTLLSHASYPLFYATGKQVTNKEHTSSYQGYEMHFTIHDADGKEIERLVIPGGGTEYQCLPVAYTKLQGHTICALPVNEMYEDGNLRSLQVHLVLDGQYIEPMMINFTSHSDIQGNGSPAEFTKAFFDKHGMQILLANDHHATSIRLPEYFTALIHNALTLPELIYILVLSRLNYLALSATSVGKMIPKDLLDTMYHHPVLETIKQKNIRFYHDLVAFLNTIKKAPTHSSVNKIDDDGFPKLIPHNYKGIGFFTMST